MVIWCQIRVQGHLSRRWWNWFDDLTITNMPDGEAMLFGDVTDQAALYGVLNRVRNAGLQLVSLHCVRADKE